ncbi:MAG: GNAT family N-acetyltransferase [Sphingomonadales bacterium]
MTAMIRTATLSDIPAMVRLEEISFPGNRLSPRSLRRLVVGPRALCLIAELDGAVAGDAVVLLRCDSPSARLYSIAVEPGLRRSGIGTALLTEAERLAARAGRAEMRLTVREDNDPAIRRYLATGYRQAGRKPGFYDDGATAMVMKKPLGDMAD